MKTIQIKQVKEPCQCVAYKFPHRAGSGKCNNPGRKPEECADCVYSGRESDPYATGDHWYSVTVCTFKGACPWGIN